jgi:hypothetical protein
VTPIRPAGRSSTGTGPYGFTPDPEARIPTILTGAGYTITVHLAPRDHSAAETNVVVQVRTAP